MQDRISAYPGRVKLTPVAGQADTYDLTRADQPTQEGTPLNKASLLSDSTVNALKSGHTDWPENMGTVTPDDALARVMWLKGQAGGFASLDATGQLTDDQIPDAVEQKPWQYLHVQDDTSYTADLANYNVYAHCTMAGLALEYNITIGNTGFTGVGFGELIADDPFGTTRISVPNGITLTGVEGAGTLSGNQITLSYLGSIHAASSIRFVPSGSANSYYAVVMPIFNGSGTLKSSLVAPVFVTTSGTSLNLTSYDYAFSGTSKTATITSLPSSGVSNGIYFYGSAWATGEVLSAGDVIKLTNSSGKTIQLNTAQSGMTYSGNVLTITPHGYRDTNCIGICLRFLRTGSYSRPFITKLYQ